MTAPARMISKEQTVAKIGRLMKKSTKTVHRFLGCAQRAGILFRKHFGLADWLYRRTVDQELRTRDDDLFTRF